MRGVFCPTDSHHVRRHLENPLNFRPLFFRIANVAVLDIANLAQAAPKRVNAPTKSVIYAALGLPPPGGPPRFP